MTRAERAEALRRYRMEQSHEALVKACEIASLACRDNLRMWQYKNEPLLAQALEVCQEALKLSRKRGPRSLTPPEEPQNLPPSLPPTPV